jgi:hypothetical protein
VKETLVVLPLLGACAACKTPLFAEGMAVDPGLSALIGNLGVIGVLIWHLWYHTTKSQPMMLERFAAEQKEMRVAFEREQKAQRDAHDRQMEELRSMLIQVMAGFRTAVHDVKDTAQVAVAKSELAAQRPRKEGESK